MQTAMTLQSANIALLPFQAFVTANKTAKVTMERDVRYWSAIYKEVPATGIVNNAATNITPDHCASGSGKTSEDNSQHAKSVRNVDRLYQRNRTRSNERWDMRTDAAMSSSKSVKCAWFRKNSAPKGYKAGLSIFLMAGR